MKKIWSVTNLSSENSLLMFQLKSSHHQSEVWTNTTIYSHTLYWGWASSEVKGWWWLHLPPSLLITAVQQLRTSSSLSQLKHSCEGVIWMCRASFTNSSCPLLWSSTVVSSQWMRWLFPHACCATANFSIIKACIISNNSYNSVVAVQRVCKLQSIPQNGGCSYK